MRLCHTCKRVGPAVEQCPNGGVGCAIIAKGWRYSPPSDFITEPGGAIIVDSSTMPGDADPAMYGGKPSLVEVIPDPLAGAMRGLAEHRAREIAETVEQNRAPVTSPDGNPKTAIGITKPSLTSIPPLAILHLGQAMADGNRKYGLVNWRHDPITMSTYIDALWRHLLALWDGQDADPKTGVKHLAYIMANCAILLDAEAQGTLTDDRSNLPGMTAALIEAMTRKPEPPAAPAPESPVLPWPYGDKMLTKETAGPYYERVQVIMGVIGKDRAKEIISGFTSPRTSNKLVDVPLGLLRNCVAALEDEFLIHQAREGA